MTPPPPPPPLNLETTDKMVEEVFPSRKCLLPISSLHCFVVHSDLCHQPDFNSGWVGGWSGVGEDRLLANLSPRPAAQARLMIGPVMTIVFGSHLIWNTWIITWIDLLIQFLDRARVGWNVLYFNCSRQKALALVTRPLILIDKSYPEIKVI